jgi:hypothetical protein
MTGYITAVSFQIFIFASFMTTLQSHSMQWYIYITILDGFYEVLVPQRRQCYTEKHQRGG